MAAMLISAQAVDYNGAVLSGAKLNVYDAGTTTPRAIYASKELASGASSANPAVATATGGIAVWVDDSAGGIKVTLTNSAGTMTYYSQDNIDPTNGNVVVFPLGGQDQTLATTDSVEFAGLTLSGNLDMQGNRIVLDADNDSYIEVNSDDSVSVFIGATEVIKLDASASDIFKLDGVSFSPTGATVGQALGYPTSATTLEPYTPAGAGDTLKAVDEAITGAWSFSGDLSFTGVLGQTVNSSSTALSITQSGTGIGVQISRYLGSAIALNVLGGGAVSGSTLSPIVRSRAGSLSGTVTSGVAALNTVSAAADTLQAKDATANEAMLAYYDLIFGGGNGARSGIRVNVTQTSATTNKADVGGSGPFMKAFTATMSSSSQDGGTSGSEYGNLHSALLRVQLDSGATDLNAIVGLEINPNIATGASALRRTGFKIVPEAVGTQQGSSLDNAISIVNQSGAAKWEYGLTFGDPTGVWPIDSSGTLIHAFSSGADAKTAAHGINLTAVTFSGNAFSSNAFAVDGSGYAKAAGFVIGSGTTPASANTLDRYAEGDITPTIAFGGGSTGVTYSTQDGEYTVIGNLVYFRVEVSLSSKGTDTGNITIPVAIGHSPVDTTPVSVGPVFNVSGMGRDEIAAAITPSGNIELYKGTGVSRAIMTDADIANSFIIYIAGCYSRAT